MSKSFGIGFGIMLAIIVIALSIGFHSTKGNYLAPEGHIGRVRVQPVDDKLSFIVVDFNVKNGSDRDFLTRLITLSVERPGGSVDGGGVAAKDLEGAFHAYPALGEQFNPVLKERDVIAAHSEADRMVGARFDLPAEVLEGKKVTLHLLDATGAEVVMTK